MNDHDPPKDDRHQDVDINVQFDDDDEFPEGGWRAWSVVLGAWCAMIPSMGMLNTIGVLDAWIGEHQLATHSKSQTGWIISLYGFMLYIGGAFIGTISDRYGLRPVIIPGSVGMVASLMCLSVSTEYYQFLLSFGVLGGFSACCLFTPSVATIGHWFSKRQGLATGVACTAGGLGGIVFCLIILYLAPVIGFPWTMRIIGFISFACLLIACLTLKQRPRTNRHRHPTSSKENNLTAKPQPNLLTILRTAIDLRPFAHDPSYLATTIAVFLIEFAVFLPVTYLSTAAIRTGLSHRTAYRLLALLNVGSVPGRALPGYLADRWGRFNVMIATAAFCLVLVFAIWLPPTVLELEPAASEAALTVFALLFGFGSGAAISLTPVCIAQVVSDVEHIGQRVGTTFSISSFGALVGVPIGGAIVDASGGGYVGLVVFSGCCYLLALVAFGAARYVAGPKSIRAVY